MAGGNNPKNWSTISDPTNTSVSGSKNEQSVNPKDWPTLSDSTNTTSVPVKKEQTKLRSDAPDSAATGMDNIDASTNGNASGARRKKQPGKTKWSRVPIEMLPYRDNKNERYHNNYENNRYTSNQHSNGYESTNGFTNGRESFRGRPYRGGRHGRGNPHRFRRDYAASAEPRRYHKLPPETETAPSVEGSPGIEDSVPPSDIEVQVMRQIEYYFSEKNLLKDTYLRVNMDEQGYVQLSLIAQFPRIKRLTDDIQLILAAVKRSCYLEVSDDVRVRPVVDPLRWPLKDLIEDPIAVNTADPYVDLMTAQLYNMCIDPSAYPHMAVPSAHELSWQYLSNGHDKNGVYCAMNVIYPHADSNGLAVVSTAGLTNGHACIPNGQIDDTNPDLYNTIASPYELDEYSVKNGIMYDPAEEIPLHFETNGVADSTDSSNASNGDESTSDLVTSCNSESNDISSEYTKEITLKNSTVVTSTANGVCQNGEADDPHISNEPQDCSSDLRHSDKKSNVKGLGQISSDVIIYNKGGKYYVPPCNEILPEKSGIPCEDDSSLTKSPEPSR